MPSDSNPSSSLLLAARDTCPLGCFFDPPTEVLASQSSSIVYATDLVATTELPDNPEVASSSVELVAPQLENDAHTLSPEPEPPPPDAPRRNPNRIARPACVDVTD